MIRPAPGDARRLKLEARAAAVARRALKEQKGTGDEVELLTLRRGRIVFALPLAAAIEVRHAPTTPLPTAEARGPGAVLRGFFALRGRALCAVDLLPLLDPESSAEDDTRPTTLVVVHTSAGELGLLVDEVLGPQRRQAAEMVPQEKLAFTSSLLATLTPDLIHVIDPERLTMHPRIVP